MAKHALKPERSSYNKIKLIIPIITAGALLSCTAAVAQADTGQNNTPAASVVTQQNATSFHLESVVASTPVVSAPAVAKLNFERPTVKSTPAPKPAPAPVVEAAKDVTPVAAANAAKPAAPAAAAVATPAATAAAAVAATNPANIPASVTASTNGTGASDAFGAAIAASAISQANLNVQQDCTMLVTNSLKAIGIDFHDWPAGYLSLGSTTTNPQVGDIIYYANGGTGLPHVAIYIGGGKAVHGGWEGHGTKIFSVNVGSGPIYIHVKR